MAVYFYEVELAWKSNQEGVLTSHGLEGIDIISPLEILGIKKSNWTPEHLLAGYISSCFMATFLELAKDLKLDILTYQSQCFVKLEMVKGKFVTKEILLRPIITLLDDKLLLKAYKCIEDAEGACPAKSILKIDIEVHPHFEYSKSETKAKAS